ncbi:hypothetical protein [Mucilaginibacter sp.]|uniref:hypothetical protein n=1 Tax=Mucilaginibacter sp. TaxID=1882438 RepID=UPI0028442B23|nr:hypothetical protein [Mucilaginibacter sp.]MDR3696510.1 hypothetical protein [Mucilaginibacter sp.]
MGIQQAKQSRGKRAAKIFLPVLIALNVPLLCIQIDSLLNPIDLSKAGKWAMSGSKVFDYIIVPVVLVILFIVQWLVFVPMWNRFLRFRRVLLSSLFIGILISVLIGAGLGYSIWSNQLGPSINQSNTYELVNLSLLMSSFIVTYCILNIMMLYFLDRSHIGRLKSQKAS